MDRGLAKLVKATDFDSVIRGFESLIPCPMESWPSGLRRRFAKPVEFSAPRGSNPLLSDVT